MSASSAIEALGSNVKGLESSEIPSRLEKYGANELREVARESHWYMLLRQFSNFLILLLVASALISLFLGEIID